MDTSSVNAAQQSALSQQIQMAVAKKGLDVARSTGDAINGLLQSALQLSKSLNAGGSFDAVG